MSDHITRLLDQIDRLDQEATPGPWVYYTDDLTDVIEVCHDQEHRYHVADIGDKTLDRVHDDAEFIALSREALPQLAKALRAVLELHKRETVNLGQFGTDTYCVYCAEIDAPDVGGACDTVQAIHDALGADHVA